MWILNEMVEKLLRQIPIPIDMLEKLIVRDSDSNSEWLQKGRSLGIWCRPSSEVLDLGCSGPDSWVWTPGFTFPRLNTDSLFLV